MRSEVFLVHINVGMMLLLTCSTFTLIPSTSLEYMYVFPIVNTKLQRAIYFSLHFKLQILTSLVFFQEYETVTSPPVHISPLDLGPKYTNKLGAEIQEYRKVYGKNYCLGQLIFWHNQSNADPDHSLVRASRGCLSLPDISSFYAKAQKPSQNRVYGPRTVRSMLARMVSFFTIIIIEVLNCFLSRLRFGEITTNEKCSIR